MLFFRVMLCVIGLLLYLVIREFSDPPVVPAGQPPLQQVQQVEAPPVFQAAPLVTPWDSANMGTFQPVAAKPAEVR